MIKPSSILVKQQDQADCGVACLATLIKYYGGYSSLERLREMSGTTRQGTTLLGLLEAAEECGFNANGFEADHIRNLKEIKAPAILLVALENNLQHYVVFFEYKDKIIVGDPAKGIVSFTNDDFDVLWKSKALLQLVPNERFEKKEVHRKTKLRLLRELIENDTGLLVASLLIGIVIAFLGLTNALFSQKLIDDILPSNNKVKLISSLILVTLLLLSRVGISYVRSFLIISQSKAFNTRIINRFYSSILRLPKSFFDSRKTGDFIARMNDTSRIQSTISVISGNVLIDVLVILLSCVFIFFYSSIIGVITIGCIPFYLLLALKLNKPLIKGQKELMQSYSFCESHFIDSIQGIVTIKSKNKQSFFETINRNIYGTFQEKSFKLGKIGILFSALSEVIGIAFMISIFSICSWMVLENNYNWVRWLLYFLFQEIYCHLSAI